MVVRMSNKIEVYSLVTVSLVSGLFTDLVTKLLVSVFIMIISTTVGFYWKKALVKFERKNTAFSRLRSVLRKFKSQTPTS